MTKSEFQNFKTENKTEIRNIIESQKRLSQKFYMSLGDGAQYDYNWDFLKRMTETVFGDFTLRKMRLFVDIFDPDMSLKSGC